MPVSAFSLFLSFTEKEYQTESKQNETFMMNFLGPKENQRLGDEVRDVKRRPRGRRVRLGGKARPHPRGPLVAPQTYFFRLYILLYPRNIRGSHETTFPPPQPSVPVRSHLGAFSGDPPDGQSITEGFYINSIALPMKHE